MDNMLIKPAVANTDMPLKAAPLVHPRAIWAPNPKSKPPIKANINLRLDEILGEC